MRIRVRNASLSARRRQLTHPHGAFQAQNVEALMAFLKEPVESGKKSLLAKASGKRKKAEKVTKKKGKAKAGSSSTALKRPLCARHHA